MFCTRVGAFSRIGEASGWPYTVAEDEKTRFLVPAFCIASNSRIVPTMFIS